MATSKALLKPLTMKKHFAILALVGVLASTTLFAQEAAPAAESQSFHEVLKDQFIAGGPTFMTPILICLILGLLSRSKESLR